MTDLGPAKSTSQSDFNHAAVIGGGVIGASWAALFLANGMSVCISDPADHIERYVREVLERALPDLKALGLNVNGAQARLTFDKDTSRAVANVDVVQENGPENPDFKQKLWSLIEKAAGPKTLLFSSSSGIVPGVQAQAMKDPKRLIIGHPFNPPHIMPLVEILSHENADDALVERALSFYRGLGKVPVRLHKAVPGFVGNRLQAALFQESVYLVKEGVVTVEELDEVVTASIGIRWATAGPFLSFHLGGGPGGLKHFIETLGKSLDAMWPHLGKATFDGATKEVLLSQADASFAKQPIPDLEQKSQREQLAVMEALNSLQSAAAR